MKNYVEIPKLNSEIPKLVIVKSEDFCLDISDCSNIDSIKVIPLMKNGEINNDIEYEIGDVLSSTTYSVVKTKDKMILILPTDDNEKLISYKRVVTEQFLELFVDTFGKYITCLQEKDI